MPHDEAYTDDRTAGEVTIHCYAELNDFLPRHQRQTTIVATCAGHESIKNLVESLGVPHPEIAALSVNGAPVDFSYLVQPGDQIEVYPVSLQPSDGIGLRPPLGVVRFILDTHLGRLAAYLRMLGFDTLYRNDYDDAELAQVAAADNRILLSRDIGLLKRSLVTYGYFVRATAPTRQLNEIVQRYNLRDTVASFQRCVRCNGLTYAVAKETIEHLLESKTRQYYDDFYQCVDCAQIYWRGSHYERMQRLVEDVLRQGEHADLH